MFMSRFVLSRPLLQQAFKVAVVRSAAKTTSASQQICDRKPILATQIQTPIQFKAYAGSSAVPASTKWSIERLVSLNIAFLIPTIFIVPSKTVEGALVALIVAHAHWGMQHIVADYIPNKIQKPAMLSLYGFSAVALGGFLYFVYSDVGIADALKQIWMI